MTRMRSQFRAVKALGAMVAVLVLSACGSLIDLPGSGDAPAHFPLSTEQVRITEADAREAMGEVTIYP